MAKLAAVKWGWFVGDLPVDTLLILDLVILWSVESTTSVILQFVVYRGKAQCQHPTWDHEEIHQKSRAAPYSAVETTRRFSSVNPRAKHLLLLC